MELKVLAIGDVVGKPGRQALSYLLPHMISNGEIDFCIANGENASGGAGITPQISEKIFSLGADVITTGDHIWDHRDIYGYIESESRLLRPANMSPLAEGRGYTIVKSRSGVEVCVINLIGRTFMRSAECPFFAVDKIIKDIAGKTRIIFVDLHAEASSEKIAMGWFLDGRVTAVFGTHTHVTTADESILPNGTAYITDLGMTGPHKSILGREIEPVLRHFTTQMRYRFDVAQDDIRLNGAIITVNCETGKATSIERIVRELPDLG